MRQSDPELFRDTKFERLLMQQFRFGVDGVSATNGHDLHPDCCR